ncbi:MAG: nicotinate-nucleotide adenylyltransferase [Lachnospiraceae bacterium]|nr:nicotinate-nucleotide adenylyltransferase [Lachnospiraceae bacterium]
MDASWKPGVRRTGIMGGTFDPIHNGHLALADAAYRQLALDNILFLPAGIPPHKQNRSDGATPSQRMHMTRLAILDDPRFSLDQEEMHRGGVSYTKDTILRLKKSEPETEFFFIIGADSLMSFDTWYHPEIICGCCHLAAAVRDDFPREVLQKKSEELKKSIQASVVLLDIPKMDISSTMLRELCQQGKSIRAYVPAAVADYIEKYGIYGGHGQNEQL